MKGVLQVSGGNKNSFVLKKDRKAENEIDAVNLRVAGIHVENKSRCGVSRPKLFLGHDPLQMEFIGARPLGNADVIFSVDRSFLQGGDWTLRLGEKTSRQKNQ